MIGGTFTTTATICKDGIFRNFGVTSRLKNLLWSMHLLIQYDWRYCINLNKMYHNNI